VLNKLARMTNAGRSAGAGCGPPFMMTFSLGQKLALTLSGGLLLFVVNSLAIVSGLLHAPEGFLPAWIHRNADTAQYLTWINGLRHQFVIPDYHAPWQTDPGFFTGFAAMLAHITALTSLPANQALLLSHLLFYLLAAYGLILCLEVFTESTTQAILALLTSLCVVPFQSYLQLARNLFLQDTSRHEGMHDFVIASSDGLFHGIAASPIVTFGTAASLLALSQVGIYLRTNRKAALYTLAAIACIDTLIHPFEVWVILGASVGSFVLAGGRTWRQILRDTAILCIPVGVALSPYIWQVLHHDWIREVADLNHWNPGSPKHLLSILGPPSLLLLLAGKTLLDRRDKRLLPLKCWFTVTLVAVYIPQLPWTQHLLDGFHYVTALLLVGVAATSWLPKWALCTYPRITKGLLTTWLLASLIPHIQYRVISYIDGASPRPALLLSAVVSRDELAALQWMRANATPTDVVLAPADQAGWFAAVPMHSFGSHWLFSISYKEQSSFAGRFYGGRLADAFVWDALHSLGIRYVIVPNDSQAIRYVGSFSSRARFGDLCIYEVPGSALKTRQQVDRLLSLAFKQSTG
jgi:hypothetical protein